MKTDETPQLVRGLKLTGAISLVIGTIIGTGIFLKTSVMTQQVGSPEIVLLVWVAAGLLSLAGALTYAELGAMLPKAGGEYVCLRAAYGDLPAFLYGWMRFWVFQHGGPIAVKHVLQRLNFRCSRTYGPREKSVHVLHVNMQADR